MEDKHFIKLIFAFYILVFIVSVLLMLIINNHSMKIIDPVEQDDIEEIIDRM
ncbi:hypothetical protein WMZ97_16560 [Lentibacillus sp. N15]|uniref:hypothetical protein n=1 Tax=Lentibacillus songyuanensis TaxID=3136161 RepID=UPI0031BA2AC8